MLFPKIVDQILKDIMTFTQISNQFVIVHV